MPGKEKKTKNPTNQYSEKAEEKIAEVMKEFKEGTLKSSSGDTVENREQAIAIGISEARRKGYKTPPEEPKGE